MFGGIVEKDGRFFLGDRFMFVNDINLENSIFEEVVEVLKGAFLGMVRIGVVKFLFVRIWILLIFCIYVREMVEESRIVI